MSTERAGVATEEGETEAVGRLVERLVARFPQVPALTVERTVASLHRSFDGARVRSFVPLLVEHEAITQLKALSLQSRQTPGAAHLRSLP